MKIEIDEMHLFEKTVQSGSRFIYILAFSSRTPTNTAQSSSVAADLTAKHLTLLGSSVVLWRWHLRHTHPAGASRSLRQAKSDQHPCKALTHLLPQQHYSL